MPVVLLCMNNIILYGAVRKIFLKYIQKSDKYNFKQPLTIAEHQLWNYLVNLIMNIFHLARYSIYIKNMNTSCSVSSIIAFPKNEFESTNNIASSFTKFHNIICFKQTRIRSYVLERKFQYHIF